MAGNSEQAVAYSTSIVINTITEYMSLCQPIILVSTCFALVQNFYQGQAQSYLVAKIAKEKFS